MSEPDATLCACGERWAGSIYWDKCAPCEVRHTARLTKRDRTQTYWMYRKSHTEEELTAFKAAVKAVWERDHNNGGN